MCVCVLTVPGSSDDIHVLLKIHDDLSQEAVLLVDVLQDLCAVVDVAILGVLELRRRLRGRGEYSVEEAYTDNGLYVHTSYTPCLPIYTTPTHTHTPWGTDSRSP